MALQKHKSEVCHYQLGSGQPLIDINEEMIEEEDGCNSESEGSNDELEDFLKSTEKIFTQHLPDSSKLDELGNEIMAKRKPSLSDSSLIRTFNN